MSLWKKLGFSLMLILIIGGLGFQDVSKDPDRTMYDSLATFYSG